MTTAHSLSLQLVTKEAPLHACHAAKTHINVHAAKNHTLTSIHLKLIKCTHACKYVCTPQLSHTLILARPLARRCMTHQAAQDLQPAAAPRQKQLAPPFCHALGPSPHRSCLADDPDDDGVYVLLAAILHAINHAPTNSIHTVGMSTQAHLTEGRKEGCFLLFLRAYSPCIHTHPHPYWYI